MLTANALTAVTRAAKLSDKKSARPPNTFTIGPCILITKSFIFVSNLSNGLSSSSPLSFIAPKLPINCL